MEQKKRLQNGQRIKITTGKHKGEEAVILAFTGNIFNRDSYMVRIGAEGSAIITDYETKDFLLVGGVIDDTPF